MAKINLLGRKFGLPGHPLLRIGLGGLLILGGVLSFLPIFGLWMVPLGLAILAVDIPAVRRLQRLMTVRLGTWLNRRWPGLARRLGYGELREERK
jgi:hypothetical protein